MRQSNPGVGSTGHYVCTQNVPFTSEPSLAPCPCLHLFALPEWRNKVDTPNRLNGGSYTTTKLYYIPVHSYLTAYITQKKTYMCHPVARKPTGYIVGSQALTSWKGSGWDPPREDDSQIIFTCCPRVHHGCRKMEGRGNPQSTHPP